MLLLGRFKVFGHSMEPTLNEHSIVFVSSVPYFFSLPKINDIVVFRKEGKTMIKRVKKRNGNKYFIEGDNKSDSLEVGWIERRDIMGKVVFVVSST